MEKIVVGKEKNRILKLHLQERITRGKGGTSSSSSGSYISTGAFEPGGILTTSGREKDKGLLPDEVDITKGSEEFQLDPKIFIIDTGNDDDDIDIDIDDEDIIPIALPSPGPISSPMFIPPPAAPTSPTQPEDNEEINRPLSLSCCKKCDNGMYTNRCFPFDVENDEDCRFPTLEICKDESDPKLPSMLDIFA